METVIRLRPSELNLNFLKALQLLLADQNEVEITVRTDVRVPAFPPLETEEEFWSRLEKARRNVESGENLVAFTAEEFEAFTKSLSER